MPPPDTPLPLRGRVFRRTEALGAGLTQRQVEWRLASGTWTALRRSVYVESALLRALDEAGRRLLFAAAAAMCNRGTVVSRTSAADVHAVPLLATPGVISLTSHRDAPTDARRRTGLVVHHEPVTPDASVAIPATGAVATSAARTLLDLARTLPFAGAVVAVDALLHRGVVTREEILGAVELWPALSRLAQGRAVIAFADPKSESPLESISRAGMRDHGLPAPETQVDLFDAAGFVARVDFLFRAQRTVGLADGVLKYVTGEIEPDPTALLRQEKRQQERIEALGFVVVRWGWLAAVNDFGRVASRLRSGFDRAARLHA